MPRQPKTTMPALDTPETSVEQPTRDYQVCEPSDLHNMCFSIQDIAEEPQPGDDYHFFKWRLFVETLTGDNYTFLINPSNKRNEKLERLSRELPVPNMTLQQRTFTEPRNLKLIQYYELTSYRPYSGTISH